MIGAVRNISGIRASTDLDPRALAITYVRLRVQRLGRRPPLRARILDMTVAYADFAGLVSMFEEIFLRRHYPFTPRRARPTIIDAGANIGLATLFFKAVAPSARVLAIEPEPGAYALLRENVAANHLEDVECVPVAVGQGESRAYLNIEAPGHVGSTLLAAQDRIAVEVEVRRLSDFITGQVDFMKLDIEGSELGVMDDLDAAGAFAQIDELAIEFHPSTPNALAGLLATLARNGYRYRIAIVSDRFWDVQQLLLIHAMR